MAAATGMSQAEEMADWTDHDREVFLLSLTREEMTAIRWDWRFWARPQQLEPPGDWSVWLALAGRGFGKTRTGSEWIRELACGPTPLAPGRVRHIALIAETAADARDVMVQGADAGILAVHPPAFRPRYTPSLRRLEWPNGCVAHTYSAEEPDQLRGPEHDLAWCDELAKWKYPDETWDMLQFGLRLGENPRTLVTTTPRPIPLVRELVAGEEKGDTVVTRGSSYDNEANLSAKFIAKIRSKYEGTRLGRQEIGAEILDDVPGALWTLAMLERRSEQNPKAAGMKFGEELPPMERIAIGVDPSGSSGEASPRGQSARDREATNDDIGIVAAGLGIDGDVYIMRDASCNFGPDGWARRVQQTYKDLEADIIVGEANYGGAMVEYTIRTVDRRLPYKAVHATRGKAVRAEPIAALYEQGRVRHVGSLGALESQMCNMTASGYMGRGSPDRMDAMVWAVTELMFGGSNRGESRAIGGHS